MPGEKALRNKRVLSYVLVHQSQPVIAKGERYYHIENHDSFIKLTFWSFLGCEWEIHTVLENWYYIGAMWFKAMCQSSQAPGSVFFFFRMRKTMGAVSGM